MQKRYSGIIFALTTHLLLDVMIVHHAFFYATGVLHHADKPYSLIRDSEAMEENPALLCFTVDNYRRSLVFIMKICSDVVFFYLLSLNYDNQRNFYTKMKEMNDFLAYLR